MSSSEKLGNVISTDLLVIGGGLSGLVAAIKAKEQPIDVTVVDKGGIGWAGQVPTTGGASMVIPPEDSLDEWISWIKAEGQGLCNLEWAYAYGGDTYRCTREITSWGASYQTKEGGDLKLEARFKNYKVGYFDPRNILLCLKKAALAKGIRMINKVEMVELLKDENRVAGAVGLGITQGELYIFKSKATLLANGSCYYKSRKCFTMNCGEGIGMAYRAGAELRNAEFTNTYSFGIKDWEAFTRGPIYLYLFNSQGERIVTKYFPEMVDWIEPGKESHDWGKVAYALGKEVLAGKGPLHSDFSAASPRELKLVRRGREERPVHVIVDPWKLLREKAGINLDKDKVEWILRFMGGVGPIKVDLDCHTTLEALWAVGDSCGNGTAWAGARNPNLFPGIGISFAIVSGIRGGQSAGRYAAQSQDSPGDEQELRRLKEQILAPLGRRKGMDSRQLSYQIHEALVPLKYNFFRSHEKMTEALSRLEGLEEETKSLMARDSHELLKCVEAENMLLSGEIAYRAALRRKESRGTHRREDYPERDDKNWLKWIIIRRKGDEMELSDQPVPPYS